MATERGKIGRLPADLRNQVNGLLRDNVPAADIIALLASKGHDGVTPQNISAWKQWGYDRWAKTQERLDSMARVREFSRQLVEEAQAEGGDALARASDAASAMAVEAITNALEDFDPAGLKLMLAADPAKFADLINSLSKIRARDQAAVLLRQKVEQYEREFGAMRAVIQDQAASSDQKVEKLGQHLFGENWK